MQILTGTISRQNKLPAFIEQISKTFQDFYSKNRTAAGYTQRVINIALSGGFAVADPFRCNVGSVCSLLRNIAW